MPEPAGPATFEDLIAYLATKPSPFDMARRATLMIEGLQNIAARLQAVEASRLEDLVRMEKLESLTKEERLVLTSVEQDRNALQKAVAELAARVDTLEKVKPVPAVGPSATSPFPEAPKPSVLQTLGLASATPAPAGGSVG